MTLKVAATGSWPPLRWSSNIIADFYERLWSLLPLPTQMQTLQYLEDLCVLKWSTACSGTESPQWVFEALEVLYDRMRPRLHSGFRCAHAFAAELDRDKQRFILATARRPVRQLFGDMNQLSGARALNIVTNETENIDGANIWMTLIGFSCKTASSLNRTGELAGASASCIAASVGSTGETFAATRLYAQQHRPRWLLLENVQNLLANGQATEVIKKLELVGYNACYLSCCPLRWGFPQRRPRLWFFALRSDILERAGWDHDRFVSRVKALDVLWVSRPHAPMDIDDVLLPDWDPLACTPARSEATGLSVGEKAVERKRKFEQRRHVRSRWEPSMAERYPDYMTLCERQRELLDSINTCFPEGVPARISNLSQSWANTATGHTPCLTPSGVLWLHHRARRIRGLECMRLQGIPLSDREASKFDSAFLADLAGNAFNTLSCASKASNKVLGVLRYFSHIVLGYICSRYWLTGRAINGKALSSTNI